jgi:alkanesulfonate monooxygenase SsuD/methylene tetrahydromethanopterin reductase-like flavin-dependent oxidoreductase (luciferase family)
MSELDQAPALLADITEHVAHCGRQVDIYTMSHVVCRPTRREAEDFYHYFAEEMADTEGQAYYRRQRGPVVKDANGNEIRRPLVNSSCAPPASATTVHILVHSRWSARLMTLRRTWCR